MNKLFSKVATLSVGLAMAIGVGVAVSSNGVKEARADDVTVNGSQFSAVTESAINQEISGFTFDVTKGTVASSQVRVFKGETLTISASSAITTIVMTCTAEGTTKYGPGCFASQTGYTYSSYTGTWTGSSTSVSFTASSNQVRITKFVISSGSADVLQSITVSGAMSKTSYTTADSWSAAGLVATGTYKTAGAKDITDKVTWSFDPATPAVSVTSVVATASIGEVSGSSSAQTVSVSKANQIQVLYTQSSGASVDVYGYYVGYLTHTNKAGTVTYYDYIIQDGEYGIMAYGVSSTEPTYTANETILHVTGSISIFNGLYEIASPVVEEATSVPEASVPSNPVVYAAKGGETADYASRLTTVTGVPSIYPDGDKYGDFESEAGTNDIRMKFAVGTKEVVVFYKKAAQTADADTYAAMKAAVDGSSEITVNGFTGWYNGFQVQMSGYIPPAEDYTAEDFAQDLLNQTDAVCAGWEEGDNNHDALEAIWSDLASNDKYPSLPAAQKTILAEANRDESGTVVEQAMARYDFLTGKYNLSNFINGRTPIVPAGRIDFSNDISQNSSMIIIVSIAATSALAFTLLLVFKKKKHN